MSGHTPGPWAWDEDGYSLRPVDGTDCDVRIIATTEGIMVRRSSFVGAREAMESEIAGNKALMEAAPDMLEALIDLVALYPLDSTDAIITSARAAIAKATGIAA